MFWFSVRQQADDAVDRQAHRRRLLARQLDQDLPPQAAVDVDGGDARHALEPLRQRVLGDVAQLDGVEVALDGEEEDRERGRVELEDDRGVGFLGQAGADAVDAAADVVGGDVEVGAPGEVEADDARAFARRGVDLLEAGDRADRLLERPRDRFLHLARADARVVDADGDARQLQLRHQVDRQAQQRDRAEQDDDPAQHEHRDRAVDGDARDAHGRLVVEGGPRRRPGVTARRNSGGRWWSDCCRRRR